MMNPEQNTSGKTDKVLQANQSDLTAAEQPDDLHDLFSVQAAEDPLAAMRDDPNYSALIKELEYIAAQARALFEPSEQAPSDDVWTKIQSQLPTLNETRDK